MKNQYIKHKIANVINISKIVTLHYFEFDPNFGSKGEKHDFWELVYADKGSLIVKTDTNKFTLSQGECFFHKPNEHHTHYADGKVAPNIFIISFVCHSKAMQQFASKKFIVSGFLRPIISGIISEGRQTFDLPFNDPDLKELRLLPSEIMGGQQMIRTYLEQFLILLLRHQQSSERVKATRYRESIPEHLAENMAKRLQNMVYSKVNLDAFCKDMRYSKAYLSKIFLKNFGCTMGEYVTNTKISEAKKLIREQRYNFSQISDLLMFSNPFYFSRVFKRVTGMSPSEYKNSVKID